MIYIRKKHWGTYHSDKCKMYLRNDFRFECAYCRMKEKDNIMGEQVFEKDHFVSKQSSVNWNLDRYDNMVYSCLKCNGTKSNQDISMVLDPCKDDIYDGNHSHIHKSGAEGYYKLYAVTTQGQQFIDDLKLNSRFYRKMRQTQDQNEKIRKSIYHLLEESSALQSSEMGLIIKSYLENGTLIDEGSDEFRCGTSKAGEAVYAVLKKLKDKGIKYEFLLTDNDLDVSLEYGGNTYYCEIRLNNYKGQKKRGPIVKKEKKREWKKVEKICGVLCYYSKQDILELYIYPDEERSEIITLL